MWLVQGCLHVLWRLGLHWNTLCDLFTGMLERQRQSVRSQEPSSSDTTNFLTFLPSFVLKKWPWKKYPCNTVNVICTWVCPGRGEVRGAGPVPEAPTAPWTLFWLLRYNERAVARLLRGKVAALQPWPLPNPGKPILGWLPHDSQGSGAAAQRREGRADSKPPRPSTG